MPAAPAIDIHAHYFPEPYIDLIARHGARCGTTVSTDANGNRFIQVGLHLKTGPITPAFYDLGVRLKEMDRQGLRMHALSLTQPMVYWADDELSIELCVAINDSISEAHRKHPDRLIGFATLPFQSPHLALEELSSAWRSCRASAASTSPPRSATGNWATAASGPSTRAWRSSGCRSSCTR